MITLLSGNPEMYPASTLWSSPRSSPVYCSSMNPITKINIIAAAASINKHYMMCVVPKLRKQDSFCSCSPLILLCPPGI